MAIANSKNERIKRKYFEWLKEANSRCDSTIRTVERAIWLYEDYTKGANLATFTTDKAIGFKKWLANRKGRSEVMAVSSFHGYVRHLRQFFKWVSQQPGFKSKMTPDMADYFKLSEKDERMARQTAPRNYPPLEYVIKLADSIRIETEVDLRDRALIAFALLSGMRDMAIVTLPLGCFDKDAMSVDQNPRKGVQTKFSKAIPSVLFRFDDKLLGYFLEWHRRLEEKGFGTQAPLFPRSKTEQGKDGLSFESATEVEPLFWKGTGRIRLIIRKRCEEAGLPYFPPHAYRHLAADLALKTCRTGEQIKAVSQNLGHEHVATTLSAYGTLVTSRMSQIIGNLKPSEASSTNEELKERLLEIANKML